MQPEARNSVKVSCVNGRDQLLGSLFTVLLGILERSWIQIVFTLLAVITNSPREDKRSNLSHPTRCHLGLSPHTWTITRIHVPLTTSEFIKTHFVIHVSLWPKYLCIYSVAQWVQVCLHIVIWVLAPTAVLVLQLSVSLSLLIHLENSRA